LFKIKLFTRLPIIKIN